MCCTDSVLEEQLLSMLTLSGGKIKTFANSYCKW